MDGQAASAAAGARMLDTNIHSVFGWASSLSRDGGAGLGGAARSTTGDVQMWATQLASVPLTICRRCRGDAWITMARSSRQHQVRMQASNASILLSWLTPRALVDLLRVRLCRLFSIYSQHDARHLPDKMQYGAVRQECGVCGQEVYSTVLHYEQPLSLQHFSRNAACATPVSRYALATGFSFVPMTLAAAAGVATNETAHMTASDERIARAQHIAARSTKMRQSAALQAFCRMMAAAAAAIYAQATAVGVGGRPKSLLAATTAAVRGGGGDGLFFDGSSFLAAICDSVQRLGRAGRLPMPRRFDVLQFGSDLVRRGLLRSDAVRDDVMSVCARTLSRYCGLPPVLTRRMRSKVLHHCG